MRETNSELNFEAHINKEKKQVIETIQRWGSRERKTKNVKNETIIKKYTRMRKKSRQRQINTFRESLKERLIKRKRKKKEKREKIGR